MSGVNGGVRPSACWQDEEANVLALVPAAVVIVLGLAALVLDGALLYLGERRVADLAAAAATDATGYLVEEAFYGEQGRVQLDQAAGQSRAEMLAASLGEDRGFEDVSCQIVVDEAAVVARCRAVVRPVLAPFWPGLGSEVRVSAEERAVALDPMALP